MRRLALLFCAFAFALAGCGGSKSTTPPTTTSTVVASPASALPGSRVLYAGGDWAVLIEGTRAVPAHLVGTSWRLDRSGKVKIEILGPRPGSTAPKLPQVAVQLTAPAPLVESGEWVDGKELAVKGGGSPTEGTIYGAPAGALKPGRHVAVAYGRTDATGSARVWTFKTP